MQIGGTVQENTVQFLPDSETARVFLKQMSDPALNSSC